MQSRGCESLVRPEMRSDTLRQEPSDLTEVFRQALHCDSLPRGSELPQRSDCTTLANRVQGSRDVRPFDGHAGGVPLLPDSDEATGRTTTSRRAGRAAGRPGPSAPIAELEACGPGDKPSHSRPRWDVSVPATSRDRPWWSRCYEVGTRRGEGSRGRAGAPSARAGGLEATTGRPLREGRTPRCRGSDSCSDVPVSSARHRLARLEQRLQAAEDVAPAARDAEGRLRRLL
jgi:hypothetical protein